MMVREKHSGFSLKENLVRRFSSSVSRVHSPGKMFLIHHSQLGRISGFVGVDGRGFGSPG
jgi:hypothetical protein